MRLHGPEGVEEGPQQGEKSKRWLADTACHHAPFRPFYTEDSLISQVPGHLQTSTLTISRSESEQSALSLNSDREAGKVRLSHPLTHDYYMRTYLREDLHRTN